MSSNEYLRCCSTIGNRCALGLVSPLGINCSRYFDDASKADFVKVKHPNDRKHRDPQTYKQLVSHIASAKALPQARYAFDEVQLHRSCAQL